MKDAHIVVGTPGRVFDNIQRRKFKTDNIKMFILDEADEMLSSGFKEQIYQIFTMLPPTTQVVLLSATMPRDVLEVTTKFMRDPVRILVKKDELTLEGIRQFYVNVEEEQYKYECLTDLYDSISVTQAVIFCNTRRKVEELSQKLTSDNFTVSSIYSDLPQSERDTIMKEFRSGSSRILISTDLLARGIECPAGFSGHQLHLPTNKEKSTFTELVEVVVSGRKGVAINFVTNADVGAMREIERFYSTQIEELPSDIGTLLN